MRVDGCVWWLGEMILSLANCITVCFRLMMTYDLAHLKWLAHSRLRPLCGQTCECTRAFYNCSIQASNSMMSFRAKVLFFKTRCSFMFSKWITVWNLISDSVKFCSATLAGFLVPFLIFIIQLPTGLLDFPFWAS